jgi:two-component system sensor histidine kinase/response regulator
MPELDGFEAARRMRALETRPRRIVALTATIDDATAARCADVGIDELAEKPLTAERVEALLALAGSIATAASAPDDVDAVDETLSAEVFDRFRRETAAHLTRSFEEVVGSLLVEIRRQATELASAVDRDDRDAIGRAAHRLRGSTATLGATRLALRTQELERSAATASASALTATLAFTLAEIDAIEHAIGRRLGG